MKKLAYSLLNYIWNVLNIRNIFSTLVVDGFDYRDKECLYINKVNKELYCLELVGSGNTTNYLSSKKIETFFEDYRKEQNAYIYEAYVQNDNFQKIYVFGNNKDMLSLISKDLDVPFLKSTKILNVLFDLFLDNDYVVKNKLLERNIDLTEKIKYQHVTESFNKIVKDSIYKSFNDTEIYQGYRFREHTKDVDLTKLFQLDWHGVIWNVTDYSRGAVESVLKDRINQGRFSGSIKQFKDLRDLYRSNDVKLAVRHSLIYLKKGTKTTIAEIGDILNTNYRHRTLFKKKLLQYTPLKYRDINWDNLVDIDFLYNSLGVVHKADIKTPNIFGKCINGSHWVYNYSATTDLLENKSSNFLLLGVIGSGKTTNLNGMIGQTVGYRLGDENAKELDNQYMRIFDIKKSCFSISYKLGEILPDEVHFMDASLGKFVYNPVNITYTKNANGKISLDENELSMNILLLSIALESKSKSPDAGLTTAEQGIFKDVVNEVYSSNYEGDTIRNIGKENKKVYEKLIALGYSDLDRASVIKEKEFDFIKAPTLDMVKNLVSLVGKDKSDEIRAQNAKTLYSKLRDIETLNIFNGHDKFDIKTVKYLYMDFDSVKGTDEFIPIFLAMFNKLFTIDKYNQREIERTLGRDHRPYITYIFEEAFNLFSNPSFELYLKKFIFESRSDRIKAGFIVQTISQVPQYVTGQIENKFFLFPSKNRRLSLIKDLTDALEFDEKTIELFHKVPEYGIALVNEHDTSVFSLDITKEEIDYYGQKQ